MVVHELAHVLYAYQAEELTYKMDQFFCKHPSPYAYLAYSYLNEAVATALGNGTFVERLIGKPDTSYTNDYIQGFAKAIYDLTAAYMGRNKTMEETFWKKPLNALKIDFL